MINVFDIQVKQEKSLNDELFNRSDVKKGIAKIKSYWNGRGFESRRELLTGSLRLTRSMSPEIADSIQACKEILGCTSPIEVYVRPEPMFNAYCLKDLVGPIIIVLSSRLVESFTPEELRFVIGHELGHAMYDHFRLPMPALAKVEHYGVPLVSRPVALKLFAWTRAAELSADRVGLICAQDPEAAASGFFKLASGTSCSRIKPDLEIYAKQVESLASAPLAREKEYEATRDDLDCFSSHPYSPIRVRAVYAFSKSDLYARTMGISIPNAISDENLEQIIQQDLALMEPGYLEEKNDESKLLRRALFTAGVVIASANHVIEDSEIAVLATLLGNDESENIHQQVEVAKKDLDGRLQEIVDANISLVKRGQLLQHLTIIAGADGCIDDLELEELRRIADKLGVDFSVVAHTMAAAASPID
ncbi:MAG TPA: M48 family metallopeptidase [Bacillota bacterium]|jgi:uncharacterized tellurite resistance protein B-like protein|nr:M48 family metallopeptidase [Bacillota bacterium]HOL10481.1 M48 family metallopeptidase [Bacillota bacterium]HPO98232.1 M48 family metallopeptidase [Bacillota bacterium]